MSATRKTPARKAATRKATTRRTTTSSATRRSSSSRRRTSATTPRTRRARPKVATTLGAALGTLVVTLLLDASWPLRIGLALLALLLVGGYLYLQGRRHDADEAPAQGASPLADPLPPTPSTPPFAPPTTPPVTPPTTEDIP